MKRVTLTLDVDDTFAPTAVADWAGGLVSSDTLTVYNAGGLALHGDLVDCLVDDVPQEVT